MKPYVGMNVQYTQPSNEQAMNGQRVHAGIVTHVYDAEDEKSVLDLTVFYHNYPSTICVQKVGHIDVAPKQDGYWKKPEVRL